MKTQPHAYHATDTVSTPTALCSYVAPNTRTRIVGQHHDTTHHTTDMASTPTALSSYVAPRTRAL
eukprot:m.145985 g.145985  ORF g.145985 m.145985 type:complete len:65 (+) comp11638_c2_seq2:506-700(+)